MQVHVLSSAIGPSRTQSIPWQPYSDRGHIHRHFTARRRIIRGI